MFFGLFAAVENLFLASHVIGLGRVLASEAKPEAKARKTASFAVALLGMGLLGTAIAAARPEILPAPAPGTLSLG